MRDLSLWRSAPMVSAFCLVLGVVATASAQVPSAPAAAPPAPAPAPVAPPAAAAPPPGAYYPPPPGYSAYPPPPYGMYARPAPVVPYEGGPVPAGYHVEERPRKGLIIAGSLVAGIPWALGLSVVVGTEYPNKSSWLLLPALGPWITLAARSDRKDCTYDSAGSYCSDDGSNSAIRTLLVLDGLMQVAGTTMLIIGLTSPTKVVARDFVGSLHFTPATVGNHGYGGFVTGAF